MNLRKRAVRRLSPAARRLPAGARQWLNERRGIEHPRLVTLPAGRVVCCVAPHPDDEMLGCGATLAKHLAAGHDVHLAFVTSGEASVGVRAGEGLARAAATREAEACDAAAVALPGATVHFLRLPDGDVESNADNARAALAQLLSSLRVDLVYAPHPRELHPDHAAVSRVVSDVLASRPTTVETVAWYEVWTPVPATHLVDVTAEFDNKLAGLRRYRSQLDVVDYVRTATGLAAFRSTHVSHGRGYAEAFVLLPVSELASMR
jgi:LmbE family N-acetylglucosaminyl deacetylase